MKKYIEIAKTNRPLKSIQRTQMLYKGGADLEEHSAWFMQRYPAESFEMWQWRIGHFRYDNHFAHIVDTVVAGVFENQISITCEDNNDTIDSLNDPRQIDLHAILREVTTNALVHEEAFARLTFENRVPYFESLPNTSVLICRVNKKTRRIEEVTVREKLEDGSMSILQDRRFYVRIQHYAQKGSKTILTTWESARRDERAIDILVGNCGASVTVDGKRRPMTPDEVGQLQSIEIISETVEELQYAMPILYFELGPNLHFGSQLSVQAKGQLRTQSSIESATQRCLNPIPILYAGATYVRGQLRDQAASQSPDRHQSPQTSHNQHGFVQLLSDDKAEYLEPDGAIIEQAHQHEKDHVDQMYRIAHQASQTIESLSGGAAASGASKQMDFKAQNVVLSMVATSLKLFVVKFVAECLHVLWPGLPATTSASSRSGKSPPLWTITKTANNGVEFEVRGLDFTSDTQPREGTVKEITDLGLLECLTRSKTFALSYLPKRAEKLLDGQVDREKLEQISKELEENFDATVASKQLLPQDSQAKTQTSMGGVSDEEGAGDDGEEGSGGPGSEGKIAIGPRGGNSSSKTGNESMSEGS